MLPPHQVYENGFLGTNVLNQSEGACTDTAKIPCGDLDSASWTDSQPEEC